MKSLDYQSLGTENISISSTNISNMEDTRSIHENGIISPLNRTEEAQDFCGLFSIKRIHLIVFLCFLAIFVAYMVRICLSQAILPMSEYFGWSEKQQGLLFAAFYYGYIVSQIPGGWLSQTFGSKYVIFTGILGSSLLNSLIPFISHSFDGFIALRIFSGIVQGVFWPSCMHLLSKWIEPKNRSLVVSLVISGQHLGTAATQGLYPYLAYEYGWEMPFFLIGFLGLIWGCLWLKFVSSEPKSSEQIKSTSCKIFLPAPRIVNYSTINKDEQESISSQIDSGIGNRDLFVYDSEEECLINTDAILMLNGSTWACDNDVYESREPNDERETNRSKILWWEIFIHKSVWAYFTLIFCYNWSFYLLVSYLPKFLHSILGYELSQAGKLALLAYLGLYITIIIGGRTTGYFIGRGYSITNVRKIGVTIGLFPTMILIFITYLLKHNPAATASLFIVAVALTGLAHSAFAPYPMDLAPRSPALIASFGNIIGTIPGIVSSLVAGSILEQGGCGIHESHSTCVEAWHFLFRICIMIYLFGWIFWLCCSKGRPLHERKRYIHRNIISA